MIREVLQSIEGVATYPIISLFLFAVAYLAVLIVTWRMSPTEIERMRRLPLDDGGERMERIHG